MKKWIAVLFAAVSLTAFADTNTSGAMSGTSELTFNVPAENSFYRAGEFSIDAFGTIRTSDFNEERTGLGVGLNYFLTRQLGIGIEASSEGTSGTFVDSGRANVIYRIPIEKSAPYLFAGGGRNFEGSDKWAFGFGVGVEHRLRKQFSIFCDVRLDKVEHLNSTALGRLGVRVNF